MIYNKTIKRSTLTDSILSLAGGKGGSLLNGKSLLNFAKFTFFVSSTSQYKT